ncbi:MAG: aldo/keto reductase [Candidatus Binataceae bacterium]|jgi:aryl-alcohol dehydrogenase-like predicted oxidoreductase
MEKRRLGRTGLEVSVLGSGGSEIGYHRAAPAKVATLLNRALDAGLNLIDTAACYDISEELIGNAIGGRRGDYYLMTKCGHSAGLPLPEWTPQLVSRSIERSLLRLRTDYIDVVQFHSCSASTLHGDDLIAALVDARDAGHARFIGYSGDGDDALYAIAMGVFDTLQISVNIADQEALGRILPSAIAQDMGIIAKRPLANAAWLMSRWKVGSYDRPYWDRLRKLDYGFLRRDRGAAVGTALRFTLSVPGVHSAIAGTTKPSRWEQNAALVAEGPLPADQYDAIRQRWAMVARADWTGQR